MEMNIHVIFYAIAYLSGAIPFGLILAKTFAGVDIQSAGSKSIGATNVLRVVKEVNPSLAKKLGATTLALDALKGIIVLAIGWMLSLPESVLWGCAVLAVIGHCFSPFLNFEGGKGVATGFGVFAFMIPQAVIVGFLVWIALGKLLKISSLASLSGLAATVAASYLLYPSLGSLHSHVPVILIALLIIYKHIPNIIRLLKGEESRAI